MATELKNKQPGMQPNRLLLRRLICLQKDILSHATSAGLPFGHMLYHLLIDIHFLKVNCKTMSFE